MRESNERSLWVPRFSVLALLALLAGAGFTEDRVTVAGHYLDSALLSTCTEQTGLWLYKASSSTVTDGYLLSSRAGMTAVIYSFTPTQAQRVVIQNWLLTMPTVPPGDLK